MIASAWTSASNLNEVLSVKAQEYVDHGTPELIIPNLNEVLSVKAQESEELTKALGGVQPQ